MSSSKEQQDNSNVEALHHLYARYFKQVYYYAFSIAKDRELAQDAVQETFLKAYRHIDLLEQLDQKEAWLKTVSRNVVIDMYRKQRREMCIYSGSRDVYMGDTDIERTIVDQHFLRELLSSLNPINRQSLLLVYEYGLTYEQLAERQKTLISAVKSRIHRAKQKLRGVALQMESNMGM
ncbi:RNA polymerase sigma factor [Paenibacillus radicis (ex Gao et al. 2016)]|uniref:RNA polymerase sigma factor n=1 Tax=Paenibacillus radicis (ex Gao et al. 2016) TaxID=1737354 RepID=A0A917GNB0_9BACL|nr:RNA polymerase sigma factor [Paenibacillus radicis (ex Gao et al. 2016)]GGG52141.1 RNA polymerase sigma factor [Paenibacillus radicis (ex Gao et al. 2016)]